MHNETKSYHVISEDQDGVYVVITEQGYWGADRSLVTACTNARLPEHRPIEFFSYVDSQAELKTRWADWLEYGKDECKWDDDERIAITAYWLDRETWDGWRVNPIDGGVTAYPQSDEHDTKALSALLSQARFDAYWRNGELEPRPASFGLSGQDFT